MSSKEKIENNKVFNRRRARKIQTHLSVAPNLDDVNDGIWPAWALPDNCNDADHDFESDN
ncbi:12229_t:CDS:2 [Dentiscutata heterogama]|uniref:12229_t:CDS:1 n=1 Tax=Dentiscutata heterogama TaxID=1316150 RepID=A0ACA9MBT3_9GLOM|nr:12229_t:CDS:2 [Dentiscutata heterogama]